MYGPAYKSFLLVQRSVEERKVTVTVLGGKKISSLKKTRSDLQCFISSNHNFKYSLTRIEVGIT